MKTMYVYSTTTNIKIICHGYHHDTMYRLTVSAWNWSNLVFNLGGSSFQVCLNLVTGPLIRPITIARKEFMLLKLLQLERERKRESIIQSHSCFTFSLSYCPAILMNFLMRATRLIISCSLQTSVMTQYWTCKATTKKTTVRAAWHW